MKAIILALAAAVIAGGPKLAAANEPTGKAVTEIGPKASDVPASQPILCYRALDVVDKEISVGLAVRLCSGTTDALATATCYATAWAPASSGGLGLTRGQAIDLCRTNSLQ